MSMLANLIKNTKALINDIRMDEEEKRMQMIAEKRTAKRTMQRSIDSNKQKVAEIEQEIAADKELGKKYALQGDRELAAVQAEKVLFKTPVLQKIHKVILNQEKIFFVLDATEDIKIFNQQLIVFDKIEKINSNPDLIGVQAEQAVDRIMQELESPLADDVSISGEPVTENPMVTNMIDEWMGKEIGQKLTSEPIEELKSKVDKKEEHKAKIKELKVRAKNLSNEEPGE